MGFLNELNLEAISDYVITNSTAILNAFDLDSQASITELGTNLYNTLQGGETITISLNDGDGHFDEGGEDLWDMYIEYDVPADGTSDCFPAGSEYTVSGGTVILHTSQAEITNTAEYDVALLLHDYDIKIKNVTVSNTDDEFVLEVDGLGIPADYYSEHTVIDPNGADMTISVPVFRMPPEDSDGTITIDDNTVLWSEIYPLLE